MNKSHYLKNYFKHNGIVLICELLIVLLLSVACTILLDGSPRWLAPVLAIAAYILAELRFMMAYIAKCVKRDRMLEEQARAAEEDENADLPADDLPTDEEELAPAEDEEAYEEDEEVAFADEDGEEYVDDTEEDEEEVDAFDAGEDEVSEVADADDEDIDTFDDDEDTRR